MEKFTKIIQVTQCGLLSPTDRIVLITVIDCVINLKWKFLSQSMLSKLTNISLATVQRSLKNLVKLKLIDYVDSEIKHGIKVIKIPIPNIDNIDAMLLESLETTQESLQSIETENCAICEQITSQNESFQSWLTSYKNNILSKKS